MDVCRVLESPEIQQDAGVFLIRRTGLRGSVDASYLFDLYPEPEVNGDQPPKPRSGNARTRSKLRVRIRYLGRSLLAGLFVSLLVLLGWAWLEFDLRSLDAVVELSGYLWEMTGF